MRIPLYLAVAQWTLLVALGFLVVVMYRQLGRVFGRANSISEHGPLVGSSAEGFEYTRVTDGSLQYFKPGNGQAALLGFVNPTCSACEQLVSALGSADEAGALASIRVLLLFSEPLAYLQVSDTFRATQLEVGRVTSHSILNAYKASITPLLVAIDIAGIVRSAGPAAKLAEVRAFAQSCLQPAFDSTMLPVVQ